MTAPSLQASFPLGYLLATDSVGQADQGEETVAGLLRQARQAMQRGDLDQADRLINRSEQLGGQFRLALPGTGDSPAKARRDLVKLQAAARQNPAASSRRPVTAAVSDQKDPASGSAGNLAPIVTRDQLAAEGPGDLVGELPPVAQVRRLMADAHIALQQGDLQTADQRARQAVALQVPDNQFAPQEPRPWTLLMEINKERQRRGLASGPSAVQNPVQFAGGPFQLDGGVQPASAQQPVPPPDGLNQLPADTFGIPSSLPKPPTRQLQATGTPSGNAESGSPYELIRRSEQAMQSSDFAEAERLLLQAWQSQDELDPGTRQRVQDQLQGLQARQRAPEKLLEQGTELDQPTMALIQEVNRGETTIRGLLSKDPQEALKQYDSLVQRVRDAGMESDLESQLLGRLRRTEQEIQNYVRDHRVQLEQDGVNREVLAEVERRRTLQVEIDQKLAAMVDKFNELMNEQRFAEARVVAQQARDLAPEMTVVQNMLWQSRFAERLYSSITLREGRQVGVEGALLSVDESGAPFDDRFPYELPKNWESLTRIRQRANADRGQSLTEVEIRIRRALTQKVEVHYNGEPLSNVVTSLAQIAGVNVFLDPAGLAIEGLTTETPVTLDLPNEISLQAALNLILDPLRLTYRVRNEVLHITSQQTQEADLRRVVYDVADLVIPIPNFVPTHNIGMAAALREAYNAIGFGGMSAGNQQVPLALLADRQNASSSGTTLASSMLGQSAGSMSLPGMPNTMTPISSGPGGLGGGVQADFASLIDLITQTVEPDTWEEVGGTGTIREFATNLSLVVSQTQEVHDQIRDLLEQLRRLQDLQVTIEVRFLTLNDNFFERIGVDFDFDLIDGTGLTANDLNTESEAQRENRNRLTIGLDPTGQPTADLDLSFTQDSFGTALPPQFTGFDPNSAANFGFAILSDIQAFFVIQAAQGDSRTNVLQAPKVTLFNGQIALVSDVTQRSFVQTVIPVVGDFAVAHQPVIMVLSEGTSLSVQAVISSDRRFVRLTMMPMFSTIDDVQEFRFEGSSSSNSGTISADPTDNTNNVTNDQQSASTGTTIQLPTFSFTSVSTTVSVPDGGTVLLGGVKRMTEGRNERGVPVLSKMPYINRLFKNVGIGRTTSSLMMMVTPRIIIQEEEEAKLGIQVPTP